MRSLWIAGLVLATAGATPLAAQPLPLHGSREARPGAWRQDDRAGWERRQWDRHDGDREHRYRGRWGGRIDGRWYAGTRAPGGWQAYRRPLRGWALPGYWLAPDWAIDDWRSYDLPPPPPGYGWSRYYDDAVLIDWRGRVYDSVIGPDWARGESPDEYGHHYYDDYPPEYYAPGATAIATIELPPPVTTTTTTTTVTEEWVYPKRSARKARGWSPRAKPKPGRRSKLIRR